MEASNQTSEEQHRKPSASDMKKFVIFSALGVLLFLVPIPFNGSWNIPITFLIDLLKEAVSDWILYPVMIIVIITAIMGVVLYVFKPKIADKYPILKEIFLTTPVYIISNIIGAIVIVMYTFNIGPEMIIGPDTGELMIGLATDLVSILAIISFTMPLLTYFGIMEFIGILISDYVRPLFKLPGRAAINIIVAWVGAPTASVLFTEQMYETGQYTQRETANVMMNFCVVSVPFMYLMTDIIGIPQYYVLFYLLVTIAAVIIAFILSRVWPFTKFPDTYSENADSIAATETVPAGFTKMEYAKILAGNKASKATLKDCLNDGLRMFMSVNVSLAPIIIAWGTIALIIVEYTSIFNVLSYPFGFLLDILGVEAAYEVAPATIVGFADMFIPILLMSTVENVATKFIVGGASLLQIIYLTETGAIMIKSDLDIGFFDILIVFLERTLLALPIMAALTYFIQLIGVL